MILSLLATIISGCSSFSTVNSEVYDADAIQKIRTFRIVDPSMGKLPEGMDMSAYNNIADAIRQQMTGRGYSESRSSRLLINFAVTIHRELESAQPLPARKANSTTDGPYCNSTYPSFIYPRANYWSAAYATAPIPGGIYKVGVVTVDLIDTATMKPLYTASASNVMNSSATRYRRHSNISKVIAKVFSDFPVQAN